LDCGIESQLVLQRESDRDKFCASFNHPALLTAMPITRIILTGHTRGIGAAMAEQLLSRGFPVLGLARKSNEALATRYPETLTEVELDLSNTTAFASWLQGDALAGFIADADTVLLINNAGMLQPVGSIEGQDVSAIAHSVSLNVAAPLMLAAAVAAASTRASDRRIVHISSGAGRNAYPGWSIYCATKAALDHHARAAALDQNRALRIGSVAPGVVDTDMQAEIRGSDLDRFPLRARFEELKRNGQLSTPEESAKKVIDYALSDSFGQTPVVDVRELS
jgi:benzil reductase ((S)-benzoin forming)